MKQWNVLDYLYRTGNWHKGTVVCLVPRVGLKDRKDCPECDGEPNGRANINVTSLKNGGLTYAEWKEFPTEVC
jgi:hypothetical protein